MFLLFLFPLPCSFLIVIVGENASCAESSPRSLWHFCIHGLLTVVARPSLRNPQRSPGYRTPTTPTHSPSIPIPQTFPFTRSTYLDSQSS
ncbi:hypothetical protein LZ32DRAFT_207594 [Colletotrichum eremochloae]|nr:hypothetical protein LZ32DRAFT_207594 [Colletotrichum eremochloae]